MNQRGICNKSSNNKYFNCPALMSDGRQFTDYRPSNYVNNLIRMTAGVMGSYDYRQFLINNAELLMQANIQYAYEMNGCKPCNFKPVVYKNPTWGIGCKPPKMGENTLSCSQ